MAAENPAPPVLSPAQERIAQRRGPEGLVSWGRWGGTEKSLTDAHVTQDENYRRTRCGAEIPSLVRHYMRGAQTTLALSAFIVNGPEETARQQRCEACAAATETT